MFTTLIVFQVLLAIGLIAIVLVQRGAGATMGAAFGAGASGTVFGSRGAGNFLTRTTGWLAVGFFGVSLTMAVLAAGGAQTPGDASLTDPVAEQAPVQDSSAEFDNVIQDLDRSEGQAEGQAEKQSGEASPESAADGADLEDVEGGSRDGLPEESDNR